MRVERLAVGRLYQQEDEHPCFFVVMEGALEDLFCTWNLPVASVLDFSAHNANSLGCLLMHEHGRHHRTFRQGHSQARFIYRVQYIVWRIWQPRDAIGAAGRWE